MILMARKKTKRHGNIPVSRSKAYEALRKKGASKEKAARIAMAGVTKEGRKKMARKAAATRKRRRVGR